MAILNSILGGALIGVAATLMLYLNGRITGISGIVGGLMAPKAHDWLWRVLFLAGLLTGGLILKFTSDDFFLNTTSTSNAMTVVGGILVGFGTLLGSGCTSGHGVCGVSRLSPRSLMATGVFMFFGFLTVYIVRHILTGV